MGRGWNKLIRKPIAKEPVERLGHSRLCARDGRPFELILSGVREIQHRGGWLRFELTLREPGSQPALTPFLGGIISGGGRGVMPWLEGRLYPSLDIANGQQFDARGAGLEAELIKLIGTLIPAGGHLMIEYESPGQNETHRELLLQVPPAASYLGALMFAAGFRGHFKDWYISEGGHEGLRKLQGNKSPNEAAAREALQSNLKELEEFIQRTLPDDPADAALVARSQERARSLLVEFGILRG
jgi:hypothetical protein